MNHAFEEQEFDDKFNGSLWLKIIKLLGKHKKYLYRVFACMVIIAIVDVIFPYLNKYAIDHFVVNGADTNELWGFGLFYLVIVLIQGFVVYLFLETSGRIESSFAYEVRKKAFAKLQELSFSYFDVTPVGWILTRVTSDIGRLAEILSWGLIDLVWGLTVMFAATGVMFYVNWRMALLVLMIVPALAYISVWFQTRILKAHRNVRKINSKITGAFNEGINGAKTTKTLGIEENNFTDFKSLTSEMKYNSIRSALLSALFMPIVMGLSSIATAALIWYGGNEVLVASIEFGTLVLFIQYANQFFEPLRQIARLMAEMQMAQAAGERVLDLLDSTPSIIDTKEVIQKYGDAFDKKVENFEEIHGDIEFKDITFYYNESEIILKGFNLSVKQGQTIALVGETGSGKSTIVNMLCRFYEPKEGGVLIDGVDYRERSIAWLHSNLGYVLQTPHLFSGTIKDNIRFGKLDATDEEIIEAAKLVNAHEFIMEMDNGYDSEVGEGGNRLSTGQKQLVSFARAIISDPRLFVLDEATSSIDTESEQIIQHAIDTLLTNRTSFIIAHRLSTIVNADRILVLKKGKIVEDGTHLELLEKKGYYYRLYTNQNTEDLSNQILGI